MEGKNRSERRKTTKGAKGTKKLGRVAQLAIRHNDEVAEAFIDDLENGRATRYTLGHVTRAFGDGVFSVRVGNEEIARASLRGMLQGRGRFHHNPEASTAVRMGAYVVMDGEQIMSVLSTGQASRARRMLGSRSSEAFNRSSEEHRNAAKRATMLAGLNTRKRHSRRSSSGKGWFSF